MVTIADFDQDKYAAVATTRCITVYIPDDDSYLPLLAGLLALPSYLENYRDPDSAQAEGVAAIWRDAYIQTNWGSCGEPPECDRMQNEANIWSDLCSLEGGTITVTLVMSSTQKHNYFVMQTTATQNQQFTTTRYLRAGDWIGDIIYQQNTDCGVLEIWLEPQAGGAAFQIATVDTRGVMTSNVGYRFSGTVPEDGEYEIQFRIPSTTGAGYRLRWTMCQMFRIDD